MTPRIRLQMIFVVLIAAAVFAAPAEAQSLSQRIEHVRTKQRQARIEQQAAQRRAHARLVARLNQRMETVTLNERPAREAFDWWSRRVGVPVVIDWEAMELEGVDVDQPISLELEQVRAWQVLGLIANQTSPRVRLIREVTPAYVEVMPRRVANRRTVVRVYDVADLVMAVPQFTNPPQLGLSASGGGERGRGGGQGGFGNNGGGGGNGGGFWGNQGDEADEALTREERGEALAQLVRDVIEPDVWAETAGGDSYVRYFDGRLIVRAPHYVHRQIGVPVGARRYAPSAAVKSESKSEVATEAQDAADVESAPGPGDE